MPVSAHPAFGIKCFIGDYSWTGDDWENIESYYGIENEIDPPAIGFSIGYFLEFSISRNLAVQPELLVTSATIQYGNGDDWIRESMLLIEAPVYIKGLLRLVFGNEYTGGSVDWGSIYFMGGLDFFYIQSLYVTSSVDSTKYYMDPDNSLLIGIALASGYEFNNGVCVGLKYSRDLIGNFHNSDIFLHGIGIEMGIKF